jgi:hypothetical protein
MSLLLSSAAIEPLLSYQREHRGRLCSSTAGFLITTCGRPGPDGDLLRDRKVVQQAISTVRMGRSSGSFQSSHIPVSMLARVGYARRALLWDLQLHLQE